MSTVTSQASSYTSSSRKGDALDFEPDKAWKDALKERIEQGLASMVDDAKKNMQRELDKAVVSPERREELTHDYHEAMKNIRALAEETFQVELERERQERRWATGRDMLPQWTEALKQEQQDIMDRIKGSQKESPSPSTAEPPDGGRSRETRPVDNRPQGPIPTDLPPELTEKRERLRRGEEVRQRGGTEVTPVTPVEVRPKGPIPAELPPELAEKRERLRREEQDRKDRERQERERQERVLKERERQEREQQEREQQERVLKERERQERADKERERQETEMEYDREREQQDQQERRQEEERERERGVHSLRGTPSRRGSVSRSQMNNREDYSNPPLVHRRPSYSTMVERQAPPDASDSDPSSEIDEETLLRPPERQNSTRKSSIHERPIDYPISKSIEHQSRPSSERYAPRSPPKPTPQIWKPSSFEEDPATTRPPSAGLARRNSTTSIRSTGSAGHRPSIAEPIPERSDSEAEHAEEPVVWVPDPEPTWSSSTSKPREKERRKEHRKSSASDQNRFDESITSFPGPRSPHRPEEIQLVHPHAFRDRYDDPHASFSSSRVSHRSEEINPRPPAMRPPMNHKGSYNSDEWDHSYQPSPPPPTPPPPRPVRNRQSFEDRTYVPPYPTTPVGRVISRPPSIPNEERERYYEQPPYRSYPTPPSSASRLTSRDYTSSYPIRGEPSPYVHGDARSNTYKYAQQPASPPKRRSSESRPTTSREQPLYSKGFSEEPYDSPSDPYPYPYDGPPSANIPILQQRPSPTAEEPEGWKSWSTEHPPHREMRRDAERRWGNGPRNRVPPAMPLEHTNVSRRDRLSDSNFTDMPDYVAPELLQRDSRQVRSPPSSYPDTYHETSGHLFGGRFNDMQDYIPPEPQRRDISRQVRSPSSSYPDNHETPGHSFGGRERQHEVEDDSDEYNDDTEGSTWTDTEPGEWRDPDEIEGRMEGKWSRARDSRGDEELTEKEARQRSEDLWRMAQAAKEEEERKRHEMMEAKVQEEVERRLAKEAKSKEEAKFEEARQKVEEAKQKAQKAKELEEARQKEEEARQQEEEARQQEEEARQKEEEAKQKAQEARKLKAARKLEEAKKSEEAKKLRETKKLEDEAKKKAEEAKKMKDIVEAIRLKELETSKKAAEVHKKEEEARKKEENARKKEAEAKKKEAEARRKEEDAKIKEEEARVKEQEARRREEEAHSKEEETRKKEEEIRQREEDLRKREEEITRREQEMESQKEAERLQKEWDLEDEGRRQAGERSRVDQERFRREQMQQEEFRRREQEIRQKAEERKRQDSSGADSNWGPSYTSSSASSPRSYSQPSPGTDRNGQTAGSNNNGGSAWASTTKPNTTASSSTSTASSTSKPRSGSVNSTFPTNPSPHPPSAQDENDWKRRQEDQYKKQQERFREEQQRMENARQRAQSNALSKDDVIALYEYHERLWTSLSTTDELRWDSVPWPMFKRPKSPDDITLVAISAYMQSPHYPEKDKSKTHKDRLKDHIKRWHPDRFETKYLPRVVEEDQERVKEGAGSVARTLNDLLTRSNIPSPFS